MNDEQFCRDALEAMVDQYAYRGVKDGSAVIHTGGMGALEMAFRALGYDDPHRTPHFECDHPDCHEHAEAGTNTPSGYRRLCVKHYIATEKENGTL